MISSLPSPLLQSSNPVAWVLVSILSLPITKRWLGSLHNVDRSKKATWINRRRQGFHVDDDCINWDLVLHQSRDNCYLNVTLHGKRPWRKTHLAQQKTGPTQRAPPSGEERKQQPEAVSVLGDEDRPNRKVRMKASWLCKFANAVRQSENKIKKHIDNRFTSSSAIAPSCM